MNVTVHLEALEIRCLQAHKTAFTNYDEVYLLGAMSNGKKDGSVGVLIGDPFKVKAPDDKFAPITITDGDTVSLATASPTMFQTAISLEDTDQLGVAVGSYSQSLSHDWESYTKVVDDAANEAGDLASKIPVVGTWISAVFKALPTAIKVVNDLDKDLLIGQLGEVIEVAALYPNNSFYQVAMNSAGNYLVTFRITRDDRDFRAKVTALSYPRKPVPPGSSAPIALTLHNSGRQTLQAVKTQLVTITEDLSTVPWSYTEADNDWFQPVQLPADTAAGADVTVNVNATAPNDVKGENLRLGLKIDGIGLVPLEGDHSFSLQSGRTMNINAKLGAPHGGLGGWYHESVTFSISESP